MHSQEERDGGHDLGRHSVFPVPPHHLGAEGPKKFVQVQLFPVVLCICNNAAVVLVMKVIYNT